MPEEIKYTADATDGTSSGSTRVLSAFCGSLRSKKFFLRDTLATDASDYLDASNHCWCCETQQVIGPDGGRVHPSRCSSGRSCYTSALGSV
ncbi:MAG: hypothetical protein ACRD6N_07170 [Pyrinomonadaceae bacterium]